MGPGGEGGISEARWPILLRKAQEDWKETPNCANDKVFRSSLQAHGLIQLLQVSLESSALRRLCVTKQSAEHTAAFYLLGFFFCLFIRHLLWCCSHDSV